MNDLQETFYQGGGVTEFADNDGDELKVRSGFDILLGENDELVGWITIDGTKIDYPDFYKLKIIMITYDVTFTRIIISSAASLWISGMM